MLMSDSHLNGAERGLQLSFRNMPVFNGLLMLAAVTASYLPMRALPARPAMPAATVALAYRPVELAEVAGPLRLAGAWQVDVADPRFGGISALAIEQSRFLAVSDRGSVAWLDRPRNPDGRAWLADLRHGPASWGRKRSRDAESLARDPAGRGWWVGYEQNHSLWLYDTAFRHALARVDLRRNDWWNNRGAEGLLSEAEGLLVVGENGRDAMRVQSGRLQRLANRAGADVADAATAPDGSRWLLLRSRDWSGISQSIAPLLKDGSGFRAGPAMPLPKGAFDNYEGIAIERRAGGLRFWLITDDGHRIMARTLLVALDYDPAGHGKGPAQGAGPSQQPQAKRP